MKPTDDLAADERALLLKGGVLLAVAATAVAIVFCVAIIATGNREQQKQQAERDLECLQALLHGITITTPRLENNEATTVFCKIRNPKARQKVVGAKAEAESLALQRMQITPELLAL